MGMDVYANGMAIACKAADGKTIAAFPDVCFTPPTAPPTPPGVPLPYPNTAMASDTTDGTKTVMIAGQEVMLKNKSVFKTSTGDEAGCAPKKGVVTSQNKGEANFICWSMDVKFEGENIPRHLDLMGHNEQCDPTNTPPWVYTDTMTVPPSIDCEKVKLRYPVETYDEQRKKTGPTYDGKQSHHVVQNAHFQKPRGTTIQAICPGYTEGDAPCVPLDDGTDVNTEHGRVSQLQKADAKRYRDRGTNPSYQEARADAKKQLTEPDPGPALSAEEAECILKEVDKKFEKMCNGTADKQLRPPGQRGSWKPSVTSSGGGVGGAA
jgi:hypothetical protein